MSTPQPKKLPGTIILRGTITNKTEKALRITVESSNEEPWESTQTAFWLPLSQIESHYESHNQSEDWILITNWLAKTIGFI